MSLLDFGLDMLSGALRKVSDDKAREEQIKAIEQQRESIEESHSIASATDYLDTTVGKSAMSAINSEKEEQEEALANNLARGGMSAEAAVAMGSELNKNYSEAVSNLAAIGSEEQRKRTESYDDTMNALDEEKRDVASTQKGFWNYILN